MKLIGTYVSLYMVANVPQPIDIEKARAHWAEYQRTHDLTDKQGQAVGIDAETGRVWFGQSASDILAQLKAAGEVKPLLYVRVGSEYYHRKGGRR